MQPCCSLKMRQNVSAYERTAFGVSVLTGHKPVAAIAALMAAFGESTGEIPKTTVQSLSRSQP